VLSSINGADEVKGLLADAAKRDDPEVGVSSQALASVSKEESRLGLHLASQSTFDPRKTS